MEWLPVSVCLKGLRLPQDFAISHLEMHEVTTLVKRLRVWYPDIAVGAESHHLDEDFYYHETFVHGGDPSRNILPIVLKYRGELAGFLTLERDARARNLTSRMAVLAPEIRSAGLAYIGTDVLLRVAQATRAEMVYYQVTLKTPHQQVIAERSGFSLVGIMPACDRDMVQPGVVKRVYEALYAKVLAPENAILVPPQEVLMPKTRRLFNLLFKHPEAFGHERMAVTYQSQAELG